jgi:hypothetical protein
MPFQGVDEGATPSGNIKMYFSERWLSDLRHSFAKRTIYDCKFRGLNPLLFVKNITTLIKSRIRSSNDRAVVL